MNAGLSGFYNAPVSKGLFLASFGLSTLAGVLKSTDLGLRRTVFRRFEIWRLISSNCVLSTPGEMFFGLALLYYFRVFERQRGSSKYGAFAFISICVYTLLQLIWLFAVQSDSQALASGPFGIIFANFVQFWYDVPASSHFSIFGVKLSDKFFVYLFGMQLLFSSYGSSSVPCILGVVAGLLYRVDAFGLRNYKFPEKLNEIISRTVGTLCASQRPQTLVTSSAINPDAMRARASSGTGETVTSQGAQGSQGYQDQMLPQFGWSLPSNSAAAAVPDSGAAGAQAVLSSLPPPSPEAVETLVAMGFDRDSALQALHEGRNDVNVATHLLLRGGGL